MCANGAIESTLPDIPSSPTCTCTCISLLTLLPPSLPHRRVITAVRLPCWLHFATAMWSWWTGSWVTSHIFPPSRTVRKPSSPRRPRQLTSPPSEPAASRRYPRSAHSLPLPLPSLSFFLPPPSLPLPLPLSHFPSLP